MRGIADDQACSECGLLAERSRNRSEYLADVPPWLIGRLAIGARLLLWAVLSIVGCITLLVLSELFFSYAITNLIQPWVPYVFSVGTISWVVGAWLLTSRGTPAHAANMPRRLRLAWRGSAALLLLLVADMYADMWWNTHRQFYSWATSNLSNAWYVWVDWTLDLIASFLVWLILSLNSVLGFLWLRRLALRVLNSSLAEHSAIVGVWFAISSGVLILFAFSDDWLERNHPFTNKTWMFLSVALIASIAACLITCALWSLLNLVRFTFAFQRAAKESRQRWQKADRAETAN